MRCLVELNQKQNNEEIELLMSRACLMVVNG